MAGLFGADRTGNVTERDALQAALSASQRRVERLEEASKKDCVTFHYQDGLEAFVFDVRGRFTLRALDEIEQEANHPESAPELFNKGDGDYLCSVYYEPPQIGDEGRIELAAYWQIDVLEFTALASDAQEDGNAEETGR